MIDNILGRLRTAPTSGLVGSLENPTSGLGPMIQSGATMSGRLECIVSVPIQLLTYPPHLFFATNHPGK